MSSTDVPSSDDVQTHLHHSSEHVDLHHAVTVNPANDNMCESVGKKTQQHKTTEPEGTLVPQVPPLEGLSITETSITVSSAAVVASGVTAPPIISPRGSSQMSTVTVTAGGITATVTTSSNGTSSTTTENTTNYPQSSINCPDLSSGVFPLTGVNGRSEKLSQLRISSLENYLHDEEEARIHALTPLQVVYEGGTGLIFTRPTPANVVRKCVYAYEDKYSFSRVLQPGMLLFDSHFECGNLHSAYLVNSNRDSDRSSHTHSFYDLYMHEDVTTSAGAQWFFFSVSGNKAKQKATFSIRNFYKQDSLFNEGMRPVVLSLKGSTTKSGEKRIGWTRAGYNISYRQETQEEVMYLPNPTNQNPNNGGKRSKKSAASNRSLKSILTFTHVFDEAQDTCFFAFCHPYTYSDLQTYLFLAEGKMQQNVASAVLSPRAVVFAKVPAAKESVDATVAKVESKLMFYYRTKLCDTLAGNRCDLLVISSLENVQLLKNDPSVGMSISEAYAANSKIKAAGANGSMLPTPPLSRASSSTQRSSGIGSARSFKTLDAEYYPIPGLSVSKSLPHIIISARVHPGETTASWSMQGFLDFILSSHHKAQELREKFVFIIIPMLNPDGVINGNNRTSLSGHDLNRNWRCPDSTRHPTIYYLKEISQNLVDKTSHDVLMYIDLHGHSRQKGAFTYGCLPDKNDIQQIREFFSAAEAMSSVGNRNSTNSAGQSVSALPAQSSAKSLKPDNSTKSSSMSKNGVVTENNVDAQAVDSVQQHIDQIQSTPHVGTRGILSRGRKRADDHLLDSVFDKSNDDNDGNTTPRRRGQLCEDNEGDMDCADNDAGPVKSSKISTHAPMLLRPVSPIAKEKSVTALDDAQASMNIDVNFDGYANNKTSALFTNMGASLETENDRNVANAFAVGGEFEKKFGTKEERVKSLPRIFMKRMLSFTQSHCSYKVPTAKLSTSRAVMALEVGVECSYTLEISLAGDNKKLFQPIDLLNIGKAMGKSLHDWMQPALALLESKRVLEEQERARQEQLDAYFNFNSKNKDRESHRGQRSRPHSATSSRARLTPSNSRGPSTATTSNMMMDLDTFVALNQAQINQTSTNSKHEKAATRRNTASATSASGLTMEGHQVVETQPVEKGDSRNTERTTRRCSVNDPTTTTAKDYEKVVYAGQKARTESPRTELPYQASVLTPSLQVRHQLPDYIFDASNKADILASPVEVQRTATKKSPAPAAKTLDIVPKLDLSVAHLGPPQQPKTGGGSSSSRSNKASTSNNQSENEKKKVNTRFYRSAHSARKTDKELEREAVAWDEHLAQQMSSNSPSKSPRASVLKDSLKYVQSSNDNNASASPPRVEYQQKQQPRTAFRSESAKMKRSPKIAPTRVTDVNWEERDAQAASTHLHIKVTTKRMKSASTQRDPRFVEDTRSDNNFSGSAKGIVAEHRSSPNRSGAKDGNAVLVEQLDILRREYEESTRQMDVDEDCELNLQSKDPGEQSVQPSFKQNAAHSKKPKTNNRGVASKGNVHLQQQQQLLQQRQQQPKSKTKPQKSQKPRKSSDTASAAAQSGISVRVDIKKK
eukprot:CAMPEP_0114457232 /NCGR_PEP_ID=MMETSP0104-20121206/4055_1 /TAXON_ID=37642 ORGANISM="Paraphysomonas imperforata, Strain PA2" /NCGR_SAMPLE_ID=MMETSP0104 /ASSEMBLY_ACC=CAM_ASM_000202 /LENGTH=1562 /DNA_ID=CAMNT_0001629769 /DNA_START=131 /DNA_END=4819 /DNA_ORIENTATION=+